jgi:hypothetical protein
MPKYLIPIALLSTLLILGCEKQRSDLVVFESKDKSYSIGFYKDTATMSADDDQVKSLGIRGFEKLEGKITDDVLFGFGCGANGGHYTTLSDDQHVTGNEVDYEIVNFDSGSWVMGGKRFMDHVSEEACIIGEKSYAELNEKS